MYLIYPEIFFYKEQLPQRKFDCIVKTAFHNCIIYKETKSFHNRNAVQPRKLLAFVKEGLPQFHFLV